MGCFQDLVKGVRILNGSALHIVVAVVVVIVSEMITPSINFLRKFLAEDNVREKFANKKISSSQKKTAGLRRCNMNSVKLVVGACCDTPSHGGLGLVGWYSCYVVFRFL